MKMILTALELFHTLLSTIIVANPTDFEIELEAGAMFAHVAPIFARPVRETIDAVTENVDKRFKPEDIKLGDDLTTSQIEQVHKLLAELKAALLTAVADLFSPASILAESGAWLKMRSKVQSMMRNISHGPTWFAKSIAF